MPTYDDYPSGGLDLDGSCSSVGGAVSRPDSIGLAATLGAAPETTWGVYAHPNRWYLFNAERIIRTRSRLASGAILSGRRVLQTSRWQSGPNIVSGDIAMPVANVGFGLLFKHMLGDVTTTSDGTGYHHLFKVASLNGLGLTWQVQRPSVDGVKNCFTYTGGKVTKWQLSQQLGQSLLLQLGLDFKDEDPYSSVWMPNPRGDALLFSPKSLTVTVAGSPFDASAVQLSGVHPLKLDRYALVGGAKRQQLETDVRQYVGNLSGEFEDMTQYLRFVNADPNDAASMIPIVLTWTSSVTYDVGKFYRLIVSLPSVRYDGNTPNVEGEGVLSGSWDFAVLAGTGEPITIDYYTSDPTP